MPRSKPLQFDRQFQEPGLFRAARGIEGFDQAVLPRPTPSRKSNLPRFFPNEIPTRRSDGVIRPLPEPQPQNAAASARYLSMLG